MRSSKSRLALSVTRTIAAATDFCRLARANKRTEDFVFYKRRDFINADPGPRQERAGILNVVNTRWLNLNGLEASLRELVHIFVLFESSSYAANPKLYASANLGRHFPSNHDIRNSEPAAGL
jgi:hypothetical protein